MKHVQLLLCLVVAAVVVHIAASEGENATKITKLTKPPKTTTLRTTKSTTIRTTTVRPSKPTPTRRVLNTSGVTRPPTTKQWKISMQNRTTLVTKAVATQPQPTQFPAVALITTAEAEDHMTGYHHGDAIQWTTKAGVVQAAETTDDMDHRHMQHKHQTGHQHHHQSHHHQQPTTQSSYSDSLDVQTTPQLQRTEPPSVHHHHRVGPTTSQSHQTNHHHQQQQHQQHREQQHGSGGVGSNTAATRPDQAKSAASLHDPAAKTGIASNAAAAAAWTTSGFFNLGRCLTSAASILSAVVVFRWL